MKQAFKFKAHADFPLFLSLVLVATIVTGCGKQGPVVIQSLQKATLSFSEPFAYDFGRVDVGDSKFVGFTITNTGEVAATEMTSSFVTAAFYYANGYPGIGGDCSDALEIGESCEVIVTFEPPLAVDYLELLRITYFNGIELLTTTKPSIEGKGVNP